MAVPLTKQPHVKPWQDGATKTALTHTLICTTTFLLALTCMAAHPTEQLHARIEQDGVQRAAAVGLAGVPGQVEWPAVMCDNVWACLNKLSVGKHHSCAFTCEITSVVHKQQDYTQRTADETLTRGVMCGAAPSTTADHSKGVR